MLRYEIIEENIAGYAMIRLWKDDRSVGFIHVRRSDLTDGWDLERCRSAMRLRRVVQHFRQHWVGMRLIPVRDIIEVLLVARDECIDRGLLKE